MRKVSGRRVSTPAAIARCLSTLAFTTALISCGGGGGSSANSSNDSGSSGAGSISILAGILGGSGTQDGTPGRFWGPVSTAVDANGNVYVADSNNKSIRKISPAGMVTTLASSSSNFSGGSPFSSPEGVAVDSSGNVYVADTNNGSIRKIASGVVTTVAGSSAGGNVDGPVATASFSHPNAIAIDASDTLYIADSGNHNIRMIKAGQVSTLPGTFTEPEGIAVSPSGDTIYVADGSLVRTISGGTVTTLAGGGAGLFRVDGQGSNAVFTGLHGITRDAAGNLYVSDGPYLSVIRKITPGGLVSSVAGGGGGINEYGDGQGTNALFSYARGMSTDASGNMYVADSTANSIRKISTSLYVSTIAGLPMVYEKVDGTGTVARLNNPNGIALDSAGNIFVADSGNTAIRKVTPTGVVSTVSGFPVTTHPTQPLLDSPYSVAVDTAGNIYAATNCQVFRITPAGTGSILAGTGVCGYQDGSAASARFSINGLAVNASGSMVYVADDGGLRKISGGTVSTMPLSTPGIPWDVVLDKNDNVYVVLEDTSSLQSHLVRITSTGQTLIASATNFAFFRVAPGNDGSIYIADDAVIRKINADGSNSVVAGSLGSRGVIVGPLPGSLNYISGLRQDNQGNLIATSENAILKIKLP